MSWSFSIFNESTWEVIVGVADIDGIVYHHYLNFLSTIDWILVMILGRDTGMVTIALPIDLMTNNHLHSKPGILNVCTSLRLIKFKFIWNRKIDSDIEI